MLHRLQRVRSRGEYFISEATLDTGGRLFAFTLEFAGNPILCALHQLLAFDLRSAGQRGSALSGLVPHNLSCRDDHTDVHPGPQPSQQLDGNVHRLLSRILALHAPPKTKQTLDILWAGASAFVENADRPGDLNQALIELGSTVCKVRDPSCDACPLQSYCAAYAASRCVGPRGNTGGTEDDSASEDARVNVSTWTNTGSRLRR